jgi:hypothetical protein
MDRKKNGRKELVEMGDVTDVESPYWHLCCTAMMEGGLDPKHVGTLTNMKDRLDLAVSSHSVVGAAFQRVFSDTESYECVSDHSATIGVTLCDLYGLLDNMRMTLMGCTATPSTDSSDYLLGLLFQQYPLLIKLAYRHIPDTLITLCDRHHLPLRQKKQTMFTRAEEQHQQQQQQKKHESFQPAYKEKKDSHNMDVNTVDLVVCEDARVLACVLVTETCFAPNDVMLLGWEVIDFAYAPNEWVSVSDVRFMLSPDTQLLIQGHHGPTLPRTIAVYRTHTTNDNDIINQRRGHKIVPLKPSCSTTTVVKVPMSLISKELKEQYKRLRDLTMDVPKTSRDNNGCTILDLDAYYLIDRAELPMLFWHSISQIPLIDDQLLKSTEWTQKSQFVTTLAAVHAFKLGFWIPILEPTLFST